MTWSHGSVSIETRLLNLLGFHSCSSQLPKNSALKSLKTTDPDIDAEFQNGNWVVNKNAQIPFCGLGTDNALEHVNRSMKVSGGLVGITLNPSARAKFFLIAPELSRLAEQANDMAGVSTKVQDKHHKLTAAVLSREEKNISKLTTTIVSYTNPFPSARRLSL